MVEICWNHVTSHYHIYDISINPWYLLVTPLFLVLFQWLIHDNFAKSILLLVKSLFSVISHYQIHEILIFRWWNMVKHVKPLFFVIFPGKNWWISPFFSQAQLRRPPRGARAGFDIVDAARAGGSAAEGVATGDGAGCQVPWRFFLGDGNDLGKLPHCDLTGIMVNKGNHPQMALFQVSELL